VAPPLSSALYLLLSKSCTMDHPSSWVCVCERNERRKRRSSCLEEKIKEEEGLIFK